MTSHITRASTAKPTATMAPVQASRESRCVLCRQHISHHAKAKTADRGIKVSLAIAPRTPQIGKSHQRSVSKAHATAIIMQLTAEST